MKERGRESGGRGAGGGRGEGGMRGRRDKNEISSFPSIPLSPLTPPSPATYLRRFLRKHVGMRLVVVAFLRKSSR